MKKNPKNKKKLTAITFKMEVKDKSGKKKRKSRSPGWCGSPCGLKGRQFDSRPGHMPGFRLGPQLGVCGRQSCDVPLPLSLSPLSKTK